MRSLVLAAVLALCGLVASPLPSQHVVAQPPPAAPHVFLGVADSGSAALIDGVVAPDWTDVAALSEVGTVVATTQIEDGTWQLKVDPRGWRTPPVGTIR